MKKDYQVPEFQVIEQGKDSARLFVASSGGDTIQSSSQSAVTSYTTGVTTGWF